MSEQQTSEATEAVAVENGWRVFKRDEKSDSAFVGKVWVELPMLEAPHTYGTPYDDDIGALGGPGEYMLIKADKTYGIETVRLSANTRYDRVEENQEPSEDETVVGAWPVAEQDEQ